MREEDEVQRALGECKDRCGLTEVAASLKPNLPDDNFEFDVAAIRGHQLFGPERVASQLESRYDHEWLQRT